jgi:protein translocase SecG subunit
VSGALQIVEILISLFLLAIILLQVRGEGAGLFAAAESTGRVRRGLDLVLFRFTIILAFLFVVIALLAARFTG